MSESSIKLAVNGAAGRMGRQILSVIIDHDKAMLSGACDAPGQPFIGMDASLLVGAEPLHVQIEDSVKNLTHSTDVIIDFTVPEVSLSLLRSISNTQTAAVIGTTGFNSEQLEELQALAQGVPVVFAPNYSVGVTVTLALLKHAAQALGDDYDVEIIEAHHRHKVDAPSGTAVKMGEVVASALNRDLEACAIYGRQGITGARDRHTIGFETIRAGDIIGEHTVLFAGNGERVEVTHRATDRMTFAKGAVHAAVWLSDREPGLYDMTDVLGMRKP